MSTTTILVTGGAGHVGSHLIELLVANPGNRVISLDNYFNGQKANHVPGAEYRGGHTREIDRVITEMPDLVYHLGEYARITPSFDDAALVYDMNIVGTFAVAEFCRKRGVAKLIYTASTTKFAVEGDGRDQNPYSFSKATNVDLIRNYGRWHNLPYAICYLSNGFGPRERSDGKYATLIAKFERLHLAGEPLPVVKPGTQRRAYTYVKDLAKGIQLVGERARGDGYVLGATTKHSVIDIATAFGGKIMLTDGYAGRGDAVVDSSKAQQELGWAPTVDVIDYIHEFVREHPTRGRG